MDNTATVVVGDLCLCGINKAIKQELEEQGFNVELVLDTSTAGQAILEQVTIPNPGIVVATATQIYTQVSVKSVKAIKFIP